MKDEKKQLTDVVTEIGVNQLEFHDPRLFRDLLGQHDQHIKIVQNTLQVKIRVRGSTVEIEGDPLPVELSSQILRQLYGLLEKGYPVYASDVDYAIRILSGDNRARLQDIFLDTIYISAHKRTASPMRRSLIPFSMVISKSSSRRLTSPNSASRVTLIACADTISKPV